MVRRCSLGCRSTCNPMMLVLRTIEGVNMCNSAQGEESVSHCDTTPSDNQNRAEKYKKLNQRAQAFYCLHLFLYSDNGIRSSPSSFLRKFSGSHVAYGYPTHFIKYCKPQRIRRWARTSWTMYLSKLSRSITEVDWCIFRQTDCFQFGDQNCYRLVCWDCMQNNDPARITKELYDCFHGVFFFKAVTLNTGWHFSWWSSSSRIAFGVRFAPEPWKGRTIWISTSQGRFLASGVSRKSRCTVILQIFGVV